MQNEYNADKLSLNHGIASGRTRVQQVLTTFVNCFPLEMIFAPPVGLRKPTGNIFKGLVSKIRPGYCDWTQVSSAIASWIAYSLRLMCRGMGDHLRTTTIGQFFPLIPSSKLTIPNHFLGKKQNTEKGPARLTAIVRIAKVMVGI